MADDPLDEWRQTLADESQCVGLLPRGQVKNLLRKKLRDKEVILEVVGALPESDPFRDRVEAVARRIKETPDEAKVRDDVLREFAAWVKIARRMNLQLRAAPDAKLMPKGNEGNMVSLVRENEIRRLIDERLREFTILDIRRADPAVFAVPWVPDLTPEERKCKESIANRN